jgi:hypothetical protein
VSERSRRWTRNPLGSARVGSNPAGVGTAGVGMASDRGNAAQSAMQHPEPKQNALLIFFHPFAASQLQGNLRSMGSTAASKSQQERLWHQCIANITLTSQRLGTFILNPRTAQTIEFPTFVEIVNFAVFPAGTRTRVFRVKT